ncbi:MAG: NUDIX hydrolase [Flavobacteriales bacterium]|nr:NUDIX hydrolase [Flavobacteriales bacterium]MCX7768170.1 NUDIX hydrolase [Flavobacteriales bacterium]MDW8409122.1 NUDIX hydrolase [Flavobacteriales bacterium]
MAAGRFLLRVYALIFSNRECVILSRETYKGISMLKFPGGGLRFGEGLRTALSREIKEELRLSLQPERWVHFYTTDFFQPSAFNSRHQVISVYYRWPEAFPHDELEKALVSLKPTSSKNEKFELFPISDLQPDMLTFPIDRHVVHLLLGKNLSFVEENQVL